ncbi:MAG: DUF4474 domain-containing protein [Lachnospiraceae bacterium]|nr:DUF4474 domain-containing protein [Lachnospiraceae bacterium]
MYFFIGFLLLIVLCLGLCFWRRRRALKKVCCMSCREKQELLDEILEPFGYYYVRGQDLISTRNDAWQRQAGYTAFFDRAALALYMVFDALPIYFDYRGRTWLIELWKGQYGINAGAEVGIYHADRLLAPEEYATAHFQAVSDSERLPVTFDLFHGEKLLATMSHTTWWLTAFLVGMFTKPSHLTLEVTIGFPCPEMQNQFLEALDRISRENESLQFSCCCHGMQAHIRYSCGCPASSVCPERISWLRRLQIRWVQLYNRFMCRMYRRITRPFDCTLDRILFLYELLPFTLRRMLRHPKGVIQA